MPLMWDGKNMDYNRGYSMVIANFLGLIGGCFVLISLILHGII
jgi:hypothetical protein